MSSLHQEWVCLVAHSRGRLELSSGLEMVSTRSWGLFRSSRTKIIQLLDRLVMHLRRVPDELITASKGLMTAPSKTAPRLFVAVGGLMLAEIGRIFEAFLADRAHIRLDITVHVLFVDL